MNKGAPHRRIILSPTEAYALKLGAPKPGAGCGTIILRTFFLLLLLLFAAFAVLYFAFQEKLDELRARWKREDTHAVVLAETALPPPSVPLDGAPIWETETAAPTHTNSPTGPTPKPEKSAPAPESAASEAPTSFKAVVPGGPARSSTTSIQPSPPAKSTWNQEKFEAGRTSFNEAVRLYKQFQDDKTRQDLLKNIEDKAFNAAKIFESLRSDETLPKDIPLEKYITTAYRLISDTRRQQLGSAASSATPSTSRHNPESFTPGAKGRVVGPQRRPPLQAPAP